MADHAIGAARHAAAPFASGVSGQRSKIDVASTSAGPGWALVGDAGHFKHPATGQGIGDAVGQAWFVADALLGADPELATYQWWRDERAAEHYEWSYRAAHWPDPERIGPMFAGLVADPPAAQQWRDLFTRRTRPSEMASSFLRLDVVVQVNHAVRVVCNLDYGKPFVILCSYGWAPDRNGHLSVHRHRGLHAPPAGTARRLSSGAGPA